MSGPLKTVMAAELIAYEAGELAEDEVVDLFQRLVDCGLAWMLQGSYGRTAESLIESGLVRLPVKREE